MTRAFPLLNTAAKPYAEHTQWLETTGLLTAVTGTLILIAITLFGLVAGPWVSLGLSVGLMVTGALTYSIHKGRRLHPGGNHNDHIMENDLQARGWIGWTVGVLLMVFYIILYWFPEPLHHLVAMMNPLSHILRNRPADHWFLYGFFYTVAVLVMGIKFLYKYRSSNYHIIRTFSVMFFQLVFAFLVPAFLLFLNQPEFYPTYFWPLKPEYLFPDTVGYLVEQSGALGSFLFFWAALMIFIATPILTFFYGKRWYCSWVCGCGGLAETAGDPFRHLSDKRLRAWKIERWLVHGVLVLIILVTLLLWAASAFDWQPLDSISQELAKWYGFVIGAAFAGVIGVGFYPLLGSRVWCRYGCPMAAILGLFQRFFSRFRITTNGGQCISCGNCSTYCEMGIDVRWYAQRNQNVVRASCVGCGICAAVCPRGVLRLENGSTHEGEERTAIQIRKTGISVAI